MQVLENTTASIITAITSDQAASAGMGGKISLSVSSANQYQMILPPRTATFTELQRLKRAFINMHKKAITQGVAERTAVSFTEESIVHKFIEYLEQNMQT